MFYSLTILTLLASILFYSFYPRNDGIKTQDLPDAKTYATEMLAHHMAAVDAARVLSYDSENRVNKMAYESWTDGQEFDVNDGRMYVRFGTYSAYLPSGFVDLGIRPALYCINNADGRNHAPCGSRTANITESALGGNDYGSSDYIITVVNVDGLDNLLVARALGEMVRLTNYSPEEHLRTQCGVAVEIEPGAEDYDSQGNCGVDNTRYLTVSLPRFFSCSGNDNIAGQLVCITQLSAAYNGTEKVHPQ